MRSQQESLTPRDLATLLKQIGPTSCEGNLKYVTELYETPYFLISQ